MTIIEGRPAVTGRGRAMQPLKRVGLVREVVDRLREQILAGEYPSGGTLPPEGKLGEDLGVSRTVVREAMRILGAQGLVEVSQGKRPRVRPADPQTVVETFGTYLQRGDHTLLDLIEVRLPLEAEMVSLAADRATDAQLLEMEKSIDDMAAAKNLKSRVEADARFHDLLAESTGNPLFSLLLTTVSGAMRRSRKETISRTGADRALRGHRAILAALRAKDAEAARRAMVEHLRMAEEDLRDK
ncbi:MAG: FadR family transcriptional regulator [Pirellulaceae bacterium]|nr:FadR family transcriptional regulator [Pirellulaceae bacterium]